MRRVVRYLRPLLPGRDDYRMLRRTWRGDLVAGVTVGVVALPLALGFGISAGAGAEAGLITAIIAGIVAAVLGGSNVQVSGPTGAMVVVLAPIVVSHGTGSVVIVAILAGILVIAAGLLKLGKLVALVPWPVIEGFTLGIAFIILLQQVPSAFGAPPHASSSAVIGALDAIRSASWPGAVAPLGIAVVIAVLTWIGGRIHARLPASLLAIILVSVGASVLGLPADPIGFLPSSLPAPVFPAVTAETLLALAGPAGAVAALAAIESLLSARVAAGLADTGRFDPDRELVGQGAASILSGVFGGMPATGAIARTAVNVRSGGRSRLSAIVHALVLVGTVFLAAPLVSRIPLAALAGVLIFTAIRMVSIPTIAGVLRSGRGSAAAFVITAIVTVSFDLIIAVGIGIAATALFALRSLAATAGVHRQEIPGPVQGGDEQIEILRIDGALFFGSAERVLERVRATEARVVILRMSQLEALDATGARVLAELIRELERRSITVLLKGIQPRHSRLADQAGVISSLREREHLFDSLDDAVAHARALVAT
jgi:SulP family sulfate permease